MEPIADTRLKRACEGDEEALCSIIASEEKRVMALCRAILGRADWAEDATQETFLRMVRALPGFHSGERGFITWLLTIARNVAISELRRRRPDAVQEPPEPAGGGDAAPIERLIAREDAARVRRTMDGLPVAYREILVLRFFQDLGPSEIAEVLGTTAENVRVKLWRAVNEMRRMLREGDSR